MPTARSVTSVERWAPPQPTRPAKPFAPNEGFTSPPLNGVRSASAATVMASTGGFPSQAATSAVPSIRAKSAAVGGLAACTRWGAGPSGKEFRPIAAAPQQFRGTLLSFRDYPTRPFLSPYPVFLHRPGPFCQRVLELSEAAAHREHAAGPRAQYRHGVGSRTRESDRQVSPDEPGNSHRSEEHTSELQSRQYLVCRLLL